MQQATGEESEMATRNGSAQWRGDLQGGSGDLEVGDGVFKGAYSFSSRFEEGDGTNPEELIAAAHAACYAMAFSDVLASNGHTPDQVDATAKVSLRNVDGAPTIASIQLEVDGKVPGIEDADFQRLADEAKRDCPVSRALASVPEIEVDARLSS
jgi:osmotically inducible protein OsmC